ncbi:hypothetical protein, partial [Photobacterium damselae]|uniref:hypothetical protein n=1 Tax=Photobacterium damselae TaxID=38293 RepID=UPI001EFC524D
VLGILLGCVFFIRKTKIAEIIYIYIWILFISISYLFIYPSNEVYFSIFKILICYISFIVGCNIFDEDSKRQQKIIIVGALISIIIGCVDFFWRYNNLGLPTVSNFYFFKKSLFYPDSNSMAIFLYPVFFCCLFILKKNIRNIFLISSLFILIIFTCSRTAILVSIVAILMKMYSGSSDNKKMFIKTLCFIALLCNYFIVVTYLSKDGSGDTKLLIIDSMLNKFPLLDIQTQLFGVGIIDGVHLYSYEIGKYAHNTIALILGQVGAIGLIIYFFPFVFFMIKYKEMRLFLITLFLFMLSYFPAFNESYFFYIGVLFSYYYGVNGDKFSTHANQKS